MAIRFARLGAKVTVIDLNLDSAEATVKLIKENKN